MEMTFPHPALSQMSINGPKDYRAMIMMTRARQANSRTVRALRRAAGDALPVGDDMTQRIHYFAPSNGAKVMVSGSFFRPVQVEPKCEASVYQSDSGYIKDHRLEEKPTGVQLTHAGHGVSRTL